MTDIPKAIEALKAEYPLGTTDDSSAPLVHEAIDRTATLLAQGSPIDMILFCPSCGLQHVDEANHLWSNPPHRSHLCHGCGTIWRPADVPINGVKTIATKGKADTFVGDRAQGSRVGTEDEVDKLWDVAHMAWHAMVDSSDEGGDEIRILRSSAEDLNKALDELCGEDGNVHDVMPAVMSPVAAPVEHCEMCGAGKGLGFRCPKCSETTLTISDQEWLAQERAFDDAIEVKADVLHPETPVAAQAADVRERALAELVALDKRVDLVDDAQYPTNQEIVEALSRANILAGPAVPVEVTMDELRNVYVRQREIFDGRVGSPVNALAEALREVLPNRIRIVG